MLSYMRENAGSWIIKVLFGIIVIVFIGFYGFSDLQKPNTGDATIAKVGNRVITMNQFQTAYKNMIEMYRSMYKTQFNEEMLEKLGLKQKVLEDLIGREILLQEAENRSIKVSDDEVKDAIMHMPVFQQDGVFNEGLYNRALNYYGMTAQEFEKEKARELVLKSLESIITASALVSDQEVRDHYRLQQEKIKISYICFDPDKVKENVKASEEELKKYYEQHKEEFREPEKAKVKYIAFDPAHYEKTVEVTPAEIEEYYQTESDQYAEPQRVSARQILLKSDKKEKDEEVYKKAEELAQKLKKGEDFEKLAKKVSEDKATADKGGDMGYFKRGDLVKPLEDAAFALKKGEVSEPVKSPMGWHIIKVEDIKESRIKPLEEVKDSVVAEIRKEKAQQMAEKEAKRAFNRLFKARNLEEFSRETGLTAQETDYFAFGASPQDSKGNEVFSKEAFALEKGELSSAFAIGQTYYILRLEDKRASEIPPMGRVEPGIAAAVEKEKKSTAAKVQAEKLLIDLSQNKQQWEQAARASGLEIKTADVQALGDYIPGLGQSKEIREAAFGLSEASPYAKTPFRTDKGFAIIRFQERISPKDTDFEKQKDALAQNLLQSKQRELFEQYLQKLKAQANTWVDKKFSSAL